MKTKKHVPLRYTVEEPEYTKKKMQIHWWHIVLIMVFIFLAADQHLTNRLNAHYLKPFGTFNPYGYTYKYDSNIHISVGQKSLLDWEQLRATVTLNNIYYNENHKTVSVTLSIYAGKLGKMDYLLGFEDWDEEKHRYDYSFGGTAFVDSDMRYLLYDKRNIDNRNGYVQELIEEMDDSICYIAETANELWDLDLLSHR